MIIKVFATMFAIIVCFWVLIFYVKSTQDDRYVKYVKEHNCKIVEQLDSINPIYNGKMTTYIKTTKHRYICDNDETFIW